MKLSVTLGWPDKALWPNGSRAHWGTASRAKKSAKDEAFWATRSVMGAQFGPGCTKLPHDGKVAVHIIVHPKTRNEVDPDNVIAGCKALLDGIALTIGINDKHFAAPTVAFAEPVSGGRIVVVVAA